MALSLNPKDAVQGGLIQNVDVEVVGAGFEIWTPPNAQSNYGRSAPTSLRLDLKILDGSDLEHTEYISCGSSDNVVPSKDGDELEAQHDGVAGINNNTNVVLFTKSLVECKFPESKLVDFHASTLVGLKFHMIRPPAPKREGLEPSEKASKYPPTYLACKEIIQLPWEKKGKAAAAAKGRTATAAAAKATTAAAAAATAAPDDSGDPEIEQAALAAVLGVLDGETGPVPLTQLKIKLFSSMKSMPAEERNPLLKTATDADWLTGQGLTISKGMVSMG